MSDKYGDDRYAKVYLPDEESNRSIEMIREALKDRASFIERIKKLLCNI